MAQADIGSLVPTETSGTELAARLRTSHEAFKTLHSGTSRPSYALPGTLWLHTVSASSWRLMVFLGGSDVELMEINPSTGVMSLSGPGSISFNNMPSVPTARFLGRVSAGTGNVEVLTVAQTKSALALNNVNNTTDANKPVSTAQQAAINAASATLQSAINGINNTLATMSPWSMQPIGVPLPCMFDAPPTSSSDYRFIKLTASDSYNSGVLTGESVSGSAPLINATAVINRSGSPLHGQSVRLLNTERRFLRAGQAGVLQDDAFQGHRHEFYAGNNANVNTGGNGARYFAGSTLQDAASVRTAITEPGNGDPRTANETRSRNIGVDYYMRIF